MSSNFKARLWHARKEQRELEVAVKEARRRWTLVERARTDSPKHTEEFAARVAEIRPKLETMMARLDTTSLAQNDYLASIAIRELEAQKERLSAYGVQAQFALAAIYDRANAEANPSSKPAASQTEPTEPTEAEPTDSAPTSIAPPGPTENKGVVPPPTASSDVPTASTAAPTPRGVQ